MPCWEQPAAKVVTPGRAGGLEVGARGGQPGAGKGRGRGEEGIASKHK